MKKLRKTLVRSLTLLISITFVSGCTFNIALTSQRTALENQIMGKYKELDDEYVLKASVRGDQKDSLKSRHQFSQQNQQFNLDDIEEFKSLNVLGEASNGSLVLIKQADKKVIKKRPYVYQIVKEENHDRKVIWEHIIETNPNLQPSDINKVKASYAKLMIERAKPGHWYENSEGQWVQKVELLTSEKKD